MNKQAKEPNARLAAELEEFLDLVRHEAASETADYLKSWRDVHIDVLEKELLQRFHEYTVADENHNLIDVALLSMLLWVRASDKKKYKPGQPSEAR